MMIFLDYSIIGEVSKLQEKINENKMQKVKK
jgi:hypothetical protein